MNASTPVWLHRYILFVATSTLVLLVAGALVTGTGSGLAVPDWPLSYGSLYPEMTGGVFYEHGHRLIAGTVGILTVLMAIFSLVWSRQKAVRTLSWVAAVAVLFQALLGGMTVLYKLPPMVSVCHAVLAQLFFCTLSILCVISGPAWQRPLGNAQKIFSAGLCNWALALTGLFLLQVILGAALRHLGAGLAIPDFPTHFGGVLPPFESIEILLHFSHRMGAYTIVVVTCFVAHRCHQETGSTASIGTFTHVGFLLVLLSAQIMLGALTIWLKRPVWVTTAHLVLGAVAFATSVTLTLQLYRRRKVDEATLAGYRLSSAH